MRKSKFAVLTAVLVLTALLTTGCTTYKNFKDTFFAEKGQVSDTVRIGVLEPQTGNDSPKGELEIRGVELAHQLAPEVLGKDIELVYADTQSSIYVAEAAVQDLMAKDPALVIGSYGDAVSLTASRILGKAGIPAIAVTATNPLITANNDFYFRVTFTDASQGRALAEYTFQHLKQKKAAVIKMLDEDTATEMSSEYSRELTELTKDEECITTIEIPQGTEDFAPYAEELKASGVETAFMPTSCENAEKMLKALDKAGVTGLTLLGPKDWHEEKLPGLQQKYPGIQLAVSSDFASSMAEEAEATELYTKFLAAYEKAYGGGEPPKEVALAFDAYMIAVAAIEKAGTTDGEQVKNALLETKDFGGASGAISFNESGEPKKTINIDVIENGKFVSVYTVK